MAEQAGAWQRVSTGGQDEASQLPDLVTWCDSHGYEIARRYVLHGKSASKGRQDAALDQVIRDMQDGTITVLVVWQSSRIERRGATSVFDLARRVREAGGRIEYVQDPYLNEANDFSDVMLSLAATHDRMKSRDISKQVIAKQAALRSAGSVVGRPPWGYEIVQQGSVKVLVPTPEGRNFIPAVFHWIIDGKSLRDVAAMLDLAGVKTANGRPWNEGYIGNRMVRNPVYYGQRRNSGSLETEALVSYSTWLEANAALSARANPGRSTVVREKALLSPVCGACYGQSRKGCESGKSPMYRIHSRYGSNGAGAYYRCYGAGPQRKGCGAPMIAVGDLDAEVTGSMLSDQMNMHIERIFIPGNDRSGEIGKLRQQAVDAYSAGDKARFLQLDSQADDLAAIPSVSPHWEQRETEQTEGDYFGSLDLGGQREYLSTREIVAERDESGPRVTIVPRWAVAS